jgi:hypothetical protein
MMMVILTMPSRHITESEGTMHMVILPAWVQRGMMMVIFTVGTSLVAAHTVLLAFAARKAGLSSSARVALPLLGGLFLAAWFAAGVTTADELRVNSPGFRPALVVAIAVAFGPMLLAIAVLASSRSLRAANAATPARWFAWIQTYRVLGLIFLYPYLYYRMIPAGFAWPAAMGDFLTGLAAPFVALALARGSRRARVWATAWNLFGLADLLIAPAAAFVAHARMVQIYPLVLVPLFIGPPIGLLTHVRALWSLAAGESAAAGRGSSSDLRPAAAAT